MQHDKSKISKNVQIKYNYLIMMSANRTAKSFILLILHY